MEESEENMSSEDVRKVDSPSAVKKPKKRSMVERELETNLTARITSPAAIGEGLSTSRYGRARRLKTEAELIESQKALLASIKSPGNESTPVKVTSPVYRMHASNSPHKSETPKKSPATYLENQIDNIYQENISLSRFSEEQVSSPAKKFPKVYIRKDLIQKREEDDNIMLIKNLFSPSKSGSKPSSNLSDNSVHSIEKYNAKPNGLIDNSSVVKTLDFDSNKKKKKEDREQKVGLSKNELFEMEAKCPYQVGDLAWARVGSFPFWPCLVTRDPYSDMFVKKKLFGRVEHDLVHVTFFGDNGRRSWIVDNMLRAYLGLREFLDTRDAFTSEDKKKDPKLYAAFFVSEKKQALWNLSVDEAETLLREPKRLRIDIFNEMLWKSRASKKPPKSGKISSRTNSDVSLSESLYDSLFSEKEAKADDVESSKKTRNKSFDVSEVVTACLDNMAAKTGITKIQRQSHMDRWLQKAKSKTPEKTQAIQALTNTNTKPEQSDKAQVKSLVPVKSSGPVKLIRKSGSKTSTKPSVPASHAKPYRFRNRTVSKPKLTQMEDIDIKNESNIEDNSGIINDSNTKSEEISSTDSDANAIVNVEKENDGSQAISEVAVIVEDDSNSTQSKKESVVQNTDESVNDSAIDAVVIKEPESINDIVAKIEISVDKDLHEPTDNAIIESSADETNNSLLSTNIAKVSESLENVTQDISTTDDKIVTSGEYNLESNKESVQDTQLSKTVEDVEQITSTSIVVATPHLDNVCPMENSQENSNIMSTPNVSQNSLMEIDQSMDDVETVQDSSEKTNTCEVLNNLMEVDESTNLKTQANEDASINSETVSNKSVEDDVSTDLKEAQNVTIEVSVTEKKKDDTINKLQQEREQESIDEPNPSQITETEVDTLIFLDESNFTTKFAETDLIPPGNSSTHEKYEERKLSGQKTDVVPTTLSHTEMNKNKVIEVKDDTSENSMINVHTETNSESTEDVINNDDKTMQFSNDVFNESTNSVSILCADDSHRITEETILDTSLNDSVRSECALENSEFQINECGNDITTMTGTTENVHTLGNGTECLTEEIQNGSTRQYVESPTFTQLLDSEEFFRDVNETPNGPTKLGSQERGQCPEITANDDEKNTNNVEKVFQDFEDDDEVTSDDEPSPEYESLDDEITEDFRKHMMSIENNIKDKKDEDQIVKICNEIAEKAKQSPTKYTQDLEIARPIDKLDTYSRSVTNSEKKGDIKVEKSTKKGTHKKVQDATVRRDENPMKQNKQCITLLDRNDINELNAPYTDFTKKLNRSDTHLRKYTHTNVAPEKCADSKIPSKEHDSKMNGDATVHEILDKPKIIYRTRSSVSSSKDRASPDVRIESLKIEQYRKSCEYEPKVVIVRLERDKMDQSIKASKAKPVDEDNFEDNNKSQVCTSGSFEDNVINAKIIETVEEKSENKSIGNEEKIINKKTRLSLKRDSPKRNRIATKEIQRRSVIPEIKSVNLTPEALKEDEIMIATNVPKKIEITNDECETSLPEPVKVNGYHHIIDRKFTDTPDSYGDTDFDVDAVSLNSEDSEVSLPNSVESIPKRSLRSRPERTLESALRNPEFLKFLELRQDYVMDMHPDLTEDEVLSYVHKTWQYEEDLKSDTKKTDDTRIKQETPRSKKSKKSQPKNCIENFFREKYENSKNTTDIVPETDITANSNEVVELKVELKEVESAIKTEVPPKRKKRSTTPIIIDLATDASGETLLVKDNVKNEETTLSETDEGSLTPRRSSRSRLIPKSLDKEIFVVEDTPDETKTKEREVDTESIGSEDSEIPLRQLRSKVLKEKEFKKEPDPEKKVDAVPANKEPTLENNINTVSGIKEPVVNSVIKDEVDETASTVSDNEPLVKQKKKKPDKDSLNDPAFIQYLELRQDAIMDENPQLSQDEIVQYLHKIWVYEESSKTALEKNDELEQEANLVKGLNNNEVAPVKRPRGRPKIEKHTDDSEAAPKEKPRRRIAQPFYNENYSDIEDELEVFEIFKTKKSAITVVSKAETEKDKSSTTKPVKESPKALQSAKKESELISDDDVQFIDETELYFKDLTKPKPNIFKGIIREKVCDICECVGSLVKCKGCHGMFHPDCVKKQAEPVEKPKESDVPLKGRKKKRKPFRKLKGPEDSESHSDDKSYDVSADTSIEDIGLAEICTIDAEYFESQVEIKMKEMLTAVDINYDSYSSDEGIDWGDAVAGTCEIVDVKLKRRDLPIDYSDFKCHNCQQHSIPVCFVCKSAISKTEVKMRQKCHVAHCNKYYHLECLDHWPQTQFNSGEPSRSNKKKNEFLESLTCPRHVCHTCVSDDPRGCKTRFSGDKLAKCVRCPATYHAFNKCLPAGSRVLTASHIVCPRHSEQRAGKVPCHVNTGWCFICALGGSLICCEYCPTSFHAECLNISPPEGNYMCEDCETGRLPLYGEMVWVKLGQYRWWPGMILHPSEIPENIMLVKHELGDFVVRFFGQYDHYWVNRGRVFPYQEGDSGRISSQKSKINADFILAIEHAQRAYTILKNAAPDEEESLDIASSLLPPHYVKLRSNKPSGALCGRRAEDPSLSLTQCECNPDEPEPCGPYSQCLNRMLLTECGPTCRAGERCYNRAFERRLYPRLTPYRTPQRGWGLKTLEPIKAGQFVIEYVGELIDEEEFRRRMRRKHEVRDENFYFLTLDKERMIDAGPKGNVARFMNHCCEPNCETQKWTVLGDVRVGLFALRDIPANSEVTFNYNLECAGIEKKRCLCGAARCSGYIGAKPKQDESQSKKGKEGKLKRQYNKKKKSEESPSTAKIKKKLGRPPKPRELTDLEKDVLIIKNAAHLSDEPEENKTTDIHTEEKNATTKRKSNSNPTEQVSLCNGHEEKPKSLKRKRRTDSISTEEVSISNGQEPSVKKLKCDKPSEVGD